MRNAFHLFGAPSHSKTPPPIGIFFPYHSNPKIASSTQEYNYPSYYNNTTTWMLRHLFLSFFYFSLQAFESLHEWIDLRSKIKIIKRDYQAHKVQKPTKLSRSGIYPKMKTLTFNDFHISLSVRSPPPQTEGGY